MWWIILFDVIAGVIWGIRRDINISKEIKSKQVMQQLLWERGKFPPNVKEMLNDRKYW